MDVELFGGQPSAIHFFLLGCFLEQRREAFLAHAEANSRVIAEPMAMADLFLKELDVSFEIQGYQRCLNPRMLGIPSLHCVSKALAGLKVEGTTHAGLLGEVWGLLARGSFRPMAYAKDPVGFLAFRNGPPFQIRPWWLPPLSAPTRSGVLKEFRWAMDNLPMDMPPKLEQETANRFGEELRKALEGIKEQRGHTQRLLELYNDLASNAAARVQKFTQIYPEE